MKILLITTHLYSSRHQAGFHHMARALSEMGHKVWFCTSPNSIINMMRDIVKEPYKIKLRLAAFLYAFFPKKLGNLVLTAYVSLAYPYSHSQRFSALKKCLFLWGFCKGFRSETFNLVVIESSASLFLFERLQKLHPTAKFVYRVSDPLVVLKANSKLLEHEKEILPEFDLVSVPNEHLGNLMTSINSNIQLQVLPHAVDKAVLEQARQSPSPYQKRRNFIFVGMFIFDQAFLDIAAQLRPDCSFHVIGPIPRLVKRENVHYYGILPFRETLPYIAHCDVALLTRRTSEHLESMAKSLKFVQYTFFQKPILAPREMQLQTSYVFSYDLTADSIGKAIDAALAFDTSTIKTSEILDWQETTSRLLKEAFADY